jgi:tetratricopeptide (TPR) repeat protein
MDADILELVRQERLIDAAELASRRGRFAEASSLFERACDWSRAAAEALLANEPRRALELALQARDGVLAERAFAAAAGDPRAHETLAPYLLARGHAAWAARLYETAGRDAEAATAWEQAGDAMQATRAFEKLGDAARAVRVLEAAVRRKADPALLLALGAILVRLGRDEPAVRALQRVSHDAAERPDALALLVPALARLGWSRTSSEVPQSAGPRLLLGRYRWIADLASSPSARAFEAEAPVSRERVVVKVFAVQSEGPLALAARSRFERDVRTMRGVDHPHLVPVRDVLPEVPATVLAKMPAGSLESLLARGPLAPARAAEIARGVLSALAEAHRRGVLHGDVKPANVLFDAAGSARLGDFGTAHLADLSATATAGAFGSLGYRSPEEREGRRASTRSDVFSAGVLLHEMLTGERPTAVPGAISAQLAPSAAHPDLGAEHDRLLARLTASDPDLRPADAFAAQSEIQRLSWPSRLRPLRPEERAATPDGRAGAPRLETLPDGTLFDTWTGRTVERIPLSDAALARARGFATAGHPALQAILRVDRTQAAIWLLPVGAAASHGAPRLRARDHACLAEAVTALHAAGVAHGSIDASHVVVLAGRKDDEGAGEGDGDENGATVMLRFAPSAPPETTRADDLAALARLRETP